MRPRPRDAPHVPRPPQDCLAAEQALPLVRELAPFLAPGREVVAAAGAVAQFQRLLAEFGGPLENERWARHVLPRLRVLRPSGRPAAAGSSGGAEGGGGMAGSQRCGLGAAPAGLGKAAATDEDVPAATGGTFDLPEEVTSLGLSPHQAEVFGLALAMEATVVTANGSGARHLEGRGVAVDAHVHRPVWLAGL